MSLFRCVAVSLCRYVPLYVAVRKSVARRAGPAYGAGVAYQHPLAYLLGIEGLALLRAWAGDYDEAFVTARLAEVRRLLEDPVLTDHPGVLVGRDATERAYEQWSASYDDVPRNGLFDLDEPVIEEILDGLSPGVAVDAACGTGRLASLLLARGHRVVGVDGSVDMISRARDRVPGLAVAVGDLAHLPLPDDSADVVVCGLALTHVDNLAPVFADLARVLRPGGDVVVSDVHPDLVLLGSVVKAVGPDGRPQQAATYRHAPTAVLRAALAAGFVALRCEEEPQPKPHPEPRLAATSPVTPDAPNLSTSSNDSGQPPHQVGLWQPEEEPERQPAVDLGEWADWPWSLLGIVPEATRAAWTNPSVIVWHFRLG